MPSSQFAAPPDPGRATTLDELADCLRQLKTWAGNPSYEVITGRVNAGRPAGEVVGKTTVVDCFRAGRRRLDSELVVAVVEALHDDPGYVTQWRQALRVVTGETEAAAQVRVRNTLPPDPAGFVGRTAELDRLRLAVRDSRDGGEAVVLSALAGMAGIGKTQLAVHVAHLLAGEQDFDRVLFVNLRGFHDDPAQPPADPGAVLDAFLRLIGVSGRQIPHGVAARAAVFRERLAGSRSLIVLDNAADEEQVRPLLPDTPGCVTLVTSRRSLTGLAGVTHLTVDTFTPAEALEFLAGAVPEIPAGDDPRAADRIAARCGHLPLALALVAGHMRAKPGWTLTDHADWLDERHQDRRLDSGVELALDVSYRNLPEAERRLLRLLAQHPGQDFDAHAASALAATDLTTARTLLAGLVALHLVERAGPGRYALHDLVRAYAAGRSADEDRRADRRAALTRLFDYYLAATVAAMNLHDPAEAVRRPPAPATETELPDLATPVTWLDAERLTLIAVAGHAAAHGWPSHTVRLGQSLGRYLVGGYHTDAMVLHGFASRAAQDSGDQTAYAKALFYQAVAEMQLARHDASAGHLEQALRVFRQLGDVRSVAATANTLGAVETRLGRYTVAAGHHREALRTYREIGEDAGAARALINLGNLAARIGEPADAARDYEEAVDLAARIGDSMGEAAGLVNLSEVEVALGRYDRAAAHSDRALELSRAQGVQSTEAWALDAHGTLLRARGEPGRAAERHHEALAIFRRTGDRDGESWALNGLGMDALAAGDPAEAVTRHAAAHEIALEAADPEQRARARHGLADAYRGLGDIARAREFYRQARRDWVTLGSPETDRIDAALAGLDEASSGVV